MNLRKIFAVAGALGLASLSALALTQTASSKPSSAAAVPMPKTDRIPMADFKKLQAAGDVVIIDVRSSDSYTSGHIPGSLSMPEETLTAAVAEKLKRMGKPVTTYCA
jgi:3-mercaptopyruvate sulfurtransferase SseA